jgi:hypothetical protein
MWETRSVFHISMPLLLRQDGLRCRRLVAQRRVRSLCVVFHVPPLRQNLCPLQRVKDLAVQELIAQLAVEALTVPVFPWASSLDVQHPGADFPQPFPQLVSDELRAVIGADVLRDPAPQHYVGQGVNHLQAPQSSCHSQRQALPRVLVDQRQNTQRSPIMGHGADKVVTPNNGPTLSARHRRQSYLAEPSLFLGMTYARASAPQKALDTAGIVREAIFQQLPLRSVVIEKKAARRLVFPSTQLRKSSIRCYWTERPPT